MPAQGIIKCVIGVDTQVEKRVEHERWVGEHLLNNNGKGEV